METEGGEGEDETPEQEMKDASEDRMRAKPNSNTKTRDGNLEKSERKSRRTGVRTKPTVI